MSLNRFRFAIDRGGTFTDVYCQCPSKDGQPPGSYTRTLKLLSEDPSNYSDAPTEAIRRILQEETGVSFPKDEPVDASYIESIRMGTTVATNALLERKGEPIVLFITKGFKDLLYIGNQCRPNLFDLSITLPENLYDEVVEIDERVCVQQEHCSLGFSDSKEKAIGTNGEIFRVISKLDEAEARGKLQKVFDCGIKSIAVVFMHSYIYPQHELAMEKIAEEIGFTQISLSSQVMPMIKIVPRGYTVCVDAYLTPAIKRYLKNFETGFKNLYRNTQVLFMQSDGGLAPVDQFSGSRAILSGPAGGVIGYAYSLFNKTGEFHQLPEKVSPKPLIGFDMGGTSTDVSRYAGTLEHVFECTTAGVTIQAPQLDINTVAAGGGSRLFFRSGLFVVGPESAGAHPGPACYRKGGPLTITDANLVLNRLIPDQFPRIFGPNCDESLNKQASLDAFEELRKQINREIAPQTMTIEEIALGFIQVANETMCRPIRSLTQGKGYDTSVHSLACFGGAGGQHACAIAQSLGMKEVLVHKYAGILSAYGMAVADVVTEVQTPLNVAYSEENFDRISHVFTDQIGNHALPILANQGFNVENIQFELYLHLRYDKTDCAIMVPPTVGAIPAKNLQLDEKVIRSFKENFSEKYKTEFGFTLPDRTVIVDDVRVRAVGKSHMNDTKKYAEANEDLLPSAKRQIECYFQNGFESTNVYIIEEIPVGANLQGPCIIIDKLSTILVEPGCSASIDSSGDVIMKVPKTTKLDAALLTESIDFVQLSIFSHRFMSIAEQMGRVLQKTAISTNIKERLDFSCAMFGSDGGLVANAPHIPVHLGAMQETVRYQMRALKNQIYEGDVILTNHPMCGGSHLPDLTVITPVFIESSEETDPVFFVASRGHHADIGGITPGSMPPFSNQLAEEGAVFESFKIVDRGVFREEQLIEKFQEPANKVPGSSASRNIRDNTADLKAQIAANNKGIALIKGLIEEYGLKVVQLYMEHIRQNAEVAVRNVLKELYMKTGGEILRSKDKLDNGAVIAVEISINGDDGSAVIDFEGTSPELYGNQCAPRAVCMSALIYCLRSMVTYNIPLNQGCLQPVEVKIPPRCLLDPGPDTAVVGGNVTTSQRIVDVVLNAFQACADSQGCMNNLTFGNERFGYYETVAGGAGAGPLWEGRSGIHTHMTNTRITDPEVLEKYYPVILEGFHLRNDNSGGEGQYKGGEGVVRVMLFRESVTVSLLTERRVLEPRGLKGGKNAKSGENILLRCNGSKLYLGPKTSVEVMPGERLVLKTPGGGGYGTPGEKTFNDMEGQRKKEMKYMKPSFGSVEQYKLIQESA